MKQAFSWRRSWALLAALAPASLAGPALATQPRPWEVMLQPAGSPIMEMIHRFNNGVLIVVGIIVLFVLACSSW